MSRPHRDRTRTTRNFFIGLRYIREKKAEGAPPGNQHKKKSTMQKEQSCSTAARIGKEEGCSERQVHTCASFAEHLERVCKPASGLEWVRSLSV